MKLSNCCGAKPLGELDAKGAGRCSKCKEGAMFKSPRPNKVMMRHVYTVTRTNGPIGPRALREEIDFYEGTLKDETGEYLYGSSGCEEDVTVEMQVSYDKGKRWQTIYGDER